MRLLRLSGLPDELRSRCRRIQHRLSDIGELQQADMRARPDRLTHMYGDVHSLALLILGGTGIAMHEGAQDTWTFLCRTPDAVEAGVRNALSQRLGQRWPIIKRSITLAGERRRSLNPDLVFGTAAAVGDVKYKITLDGSIGRTDLNQVATFATGYRIDKAVVVAFGTREIGEDVRVGPVAINGFNWNTSEPMPSRAADRLAEHVEGWLSAPQNSTGADTAHPPVLPRHCRRPIEMPDGRDWISAPTP
jgi:hypothetical protein